MKTNVTKAFRIWSGLAMVLLVMAGQATAQQPSPSPKKPDETKTETYC